MLTSKTRIEFARTADIAAIARLSRDEIEHGLGWRYTPRHLAWLLRHKQKNVVAAHIDDTLAGFGIMTYHQHQANLDLLAVKVQFRHNRIGTHLVAWLSKVALMAGIYNVYVQVRATNGIALAFYCDLGFQQLDVLPGYYNGVESAVIMARSLRQLVGIR